MIKKICVDCEAEFDGEEDDDLCPACNKKYDDLYRKENLINGYDTEYLPVHLIHMGEEKEE